MVAPTKYTFDTDTQGVDKTSGSTGTLAWDEENGAISLAAGEDLLVNTTSFDSSNDNLGDFVLKYDFIAVDHNWLNDYMSFRIPGNVLLRTFALSSGGKWKASANHLGFFLM